MTLIFLGQSQERIERNPFTFKAEGQQGSKDETSYARKNKQHQSMEIKSDSKSSR